MHGVGDRLTLEPRVELPDDQIGDKGRGDKGDEPGKEVGLSKENKVADRPHGAETAPLGEKADGETDPQGDQEGRVHGARAFQTVKEDAAPVLSLNLGKDYQERQEAEHDQGHHPSCRFVGRLGPSQIVSLSQKECRDPDPEYQPQETKDSIPVASGKSQHGTPGAPKKNERTDHRENAQHKPDDGGGTDAGAKLPEEIGRAERSQDEADDLGANVLYNRGTVQPQSARDVPLETGDTDPHIPRVSPLLQEGGKYADHDPDTDNPPAGGKNIFQAHRLEIPFLIINRGISKSIFSIKQIHNGNRVKRVNTLYQ